MWDENSVSMSVHQEWRTHETYEANRPTDVIAQMERPLTEAGGVLSSVAEFAMDDLDAGTYYLHAAVLDRDASLGTVSRLILK